MNILEIISILVAIFAMIFLSYIILQMYRENLNGKIITGGYPSTSYIQKVIDALDEKKCVLYGMDGCPWCQKQKEAFGGDFHRLTYKSVNTMNPEDYKELKDINGFPTWKCHKTGQVHSGYLDLNKLVDVFNLNNEK